MKTSERGVVNATQYGFNHPEAYCVMHYSTEDDSEQEVIWNSRDGVTPFFVSTRDGSREMRHVNWSLDTLSPTYIPAIGSRIFVDLTRELALPAARERVERDWEHPEYPMKKSFATKEDAVEMLISGWLKREGSPHIIEVTPAIHEHFKLLSLEWERAISSMPHHRLGEFKPDVKRAERTLRILLEAAERRRKRNEKRLKANG